MTFLIAQSVVIDEAENRMWVQISYFSFTRTLMNIFFDKIEPVTKMHIFPRSYDNRKMSAGRIFACGKSFEDKRFITSLNWHRVVSQRWKRRYRRCRTWQQKSTERICGKCQRPSRLEILSIFELGRCRGSLHQRKSQRSRSCFKSEGSGAVVTIPVKIRWIFNNSHFFSEKLARINHSADYCEELAWMLKNLRSMWNHQTCP